MPYARFEKAAVDAAGNVLANVWCEVRREDVAGNPLEPLFSDRLGTVPLSNPFMAADGVPAFHAAGGAYRVRYYKAGFDETYRYQAVGLGAENDLQGFVPMGAWDIATTYEIGDVVTHPDGGDLYLFASKVNDNLAEEPDVTPQDSAFWMYVGVAVAGPAGPEGPEGPEGPPNVLTIGTVTEGPAAASFSGSSPAQVLNLVIPPSAIQLDVGEEAFSYVIEDEDGRVALAVRENGSVLVPRLDVEQLASHVEFSARQVSVADAGGNEAMGIDLIPGASAFSIEDAEGRQSLRLLPTGLSIPSVYRDISIGSRGRTAGSSTHLVVSRRRSPLSRNFDLYALDLSSGAEVQLTTDDSDRHDFSDPAIIGTDCMYQRRGMERSEAFVVPLTGGTAQPAFPEEFIVVNGDSFTGPGWDAALAANFARARKIISIGVGGTSIVQQATVFAGMPYLQGGKLIIMEGGWDSNAADSIVAIQSQIDDMSSYFKHWCLVEPSPGELVLGSPDRIAWDLKVDAIDDAFPGHMVRCLADLQAANDGSPDDLADVANGIVPRSLRQPGDVIHETAVAANIRAGLVADFFEERGW